MRVSVVIPVHGKAQLTAHCLSTLRDELRERPDVEVIVVDDSSPDDTRFVVDAQAWVRLLRLDQQSGFAVSCNTGASASSGEYVVFLNNDTVGRPGWLDSLVAYADQHDEVGAVGAKLLYPNDTIQHAGIVMSSDLLPRHVYRGFPADHPAVSRLRPFQAVTGACMLVRRRIFQKLGGLDEAFANGFEDVDFCLRLRASGHEVHYCAASVLTHLEAATRGEDAKAFRRNADLFLGRWRESIRSDELATYAEDGLIRIESGDVYPLRFTVSPELAVIETDQLEAFKLLGLRSHQVFDLLKENTALRFPDGGPSSTGRAIA
jgi:GT2 family glycosyltransferase